MTQKLRIWELVQSLCEFGGLILFGGDFIEILIMSEIKGGVGIAIILNIF